LDWQSPSPEHPFPFGCSPHVPSMHRLVEVRQSVELEHGCPSSAPHTPSSQMPEMQSLAREHGNWLSDGPQLAPPVVAVLQSFDGQSASLMHGPHCPTLPPHSSQMHTPVVHSSSREQLDPSGCGGPQTPVG
jgi:hypothetical protein